MSHNTNQCRDADTDVQKSVSETAELFNLVGNARRIHALTGICQRNGDVFTVGTMVDWVAEAECDAVDEEHRKSVYIALFQCHLPRLAAARVIYYDKDTAKVRPRPRFDDAMRVLDSVLPTDF